MRSDMRSNGQGNSPGSFLCDCGLKLSIVFPLLFVFYASAIYLDLSYQYVLAWGLVAILWIASRFQAIQEPPGRIFILLLGAFVSLRYMVFRATETLIYTGFLDFSLMALLFLSECYGFAIHALGMFVNAWPLKREAAPLPPDPSRWPVVDVFIPTYNEPLDIVGITTIACAQMDYPREKLNIYILDDGGTLAKRNDPSPEKARAARNRHEQVRALADFLEVSYLTRDDNAHAKAGNINAALESTASGQGGRSPGELVLILDCDHVPAKDFLRSTAGYFLQDPKLFLVQTPHFFINPDPVEKNLQTFQDHPGENEMFYGAVQYGLDSWNGTFFCGSAALLRRDLLVEAGGVAGDTITEDAETALGLHAKGYNSVYVGKPMICGLSPETFGDFILQRARWAQGMIQIFLLKNPLFVKGLKLPQRLCYLNSCFFWFFGGARFVFLTAPLAYLFFGMNVYNATLSQVLAYAVPHVFASMLVSDFLYGRVRHPFFSELYEAIQSVFLAPAVLSTLKSPRAPSFKVTPKGGDLTKDFMSPLAFPFYVLLVLYLLAFLSGAYRWVAHPLEHQGVLICGFWNGFNLIFVLASLGVVWQIGDQRGDHRIMTDEEALISPESSGVEIPVEMKDISLGGCRLQTRQKAPPKRGRIIELRAKDSLGNYHRFDADVAWTKRKGEGWELGCEFIIEDELTIYRIGSFVYGDSNRWVRYWEARRRHPVGTLKAFFYLLERGIVGAVRNAKGIYALSRSALKKCGTVVEGEVKKWCRIKAKTEIS